MSCENCQDEDGLCMYPYYGTAPHETIARPTKDGYVIGSIPNPHETWPANFHEDPEAPGCGTYTHCPECSDSIEVPTGAREEGR